MHSRFRHHAVAIAVCGALMLVEFIALQTIAGPRSAMATPAHAPCEAPAPLPVIPVKI